MLGKIKTSLAIESWQKSAIGPSLLLMIIWITLILGVNPIGNFPLNDDWVYGLAVREILEKGEFRLPSPASANVFSQAYWGALFSLPFGFSFTALRFSTLVLGAIGILTTHALLLEVKATQKVAFIGALLIAVSPLYLGLSITFMTDVPFTAVILLSCYFYIRGLQQDSTFAILFALSLSYIALLIRQFGIVIFIAFGIAYIFQKGVKLKNMVLGFTPLILAVILQVSYQRWLVETGRTPPVQDIRAMDFVNGLLSGSGRDILRNLWVIFVYAGLLLLPFLMLFLVGRLWGEVSPKHRNRTLWALFGFTLPVTGIYILKGKLMPFSTNILTYFGMGPLTLKDTFILKINTPLYSATVRIFWSVATFFGILGAAILFYYLVMAIALTVRQSFQTKTRADSGLNIFLLSAIVFYCLILGISGLFDRYLLPLFPLLMMVIVLASPSPSQRGERPFDRPITVLVLAVILLYGILSMAATHDYLAWNRTRWQATEDLMTRSITPREIDGGYEFNGWYLYDINYRKQKGKSYWWVDDDEYLIASGPMKRYQEIQRYPYGKWLPPGQGNISVLRKIPKRSIP